MSERALHLIGDPDRTRLLTERSARCARIDKLSVDRSHLAKMPRLPWSIEAEAAEAKMEAIRAETNLSSRVEAWRGLFAMTGR